MSTLREHAHGCVERRIVKVVTVSELLFPRARQVVRITSSTRRTGSQRSERRTAYAVISLTAEHASATEPTAIVRVHWRIEALHWIRDVTHDEDRSQTRTDQGLRVMASSRNLAFTLHRAAGATNIAAALRDHAWNPREAAELLMAIQNNFAEALGLILLRDQPPLAPPVGSGIRIEPLHPAW